MIHHSENPRREMSSGEAGVVGAVLGFGLIALALYLVVARYHIRREQLVEAALYLFIITAAIAVPVLRKFSGKDARRKRPPFVMPARRDERAIEAAWNQSAVLLGYDMDEKPWLWPDEVRVMQGIVLGMTGSGKTTLLKNIITQDIARFVGPPEDRHRIPIVVFDGKGDLEFFEHLLPHIHRAGRLHQLRLLNPSRPEFSALYNPFFTRDDNYMAQVNMIFGSFNLHDEFFAKHQLNYLGDIVRVLFYTGARYNFYDVIVMLLDQDVLKEQIEKAMHRLDRDGSITAQQRLNFEMSVKNLMQSLEDRERVPKIQGLINECMTFLDDELSAVTGQYDDLLSIEDVIDQELILFVSLNANKNTEPVRSLGKCFCRTSNSPSESVTRTKQTGDGRIALSSLLCWMSSRRLAIAISRRSFRPRGAQTLHSCSRCKAFPNLCRSAAVSRRRSPRRRIRRSRSGRGTKKRPSISSKLRPNKS